MFPSGQTMFSCLKWHFTHYLLLPGLLHLMDDAKPQEKEVIPTKEVLPDHMEELRKIGFPEIEGDLSPSAIAPKACNTIHKQLGKLQALIAGFPGDAAGLQLRTH